jgi:hypothetical protein
MYSHVKSRVQTSLPGPETTSYSSKKTTRRKNQSFDKTFWALSLALASDKSHIITYPLQEKKPKY